MTLPDKYRVLIITLSDRAANREYDDLSGPRIRELLAGFLSSEGWDYDIDSVVIPDSEEKLSNLIMDGRNRYNFIFTTGGTGIGPRDITVETVSMLLDREIPGIMDFIRIKYGAENPGALLSRGIAGLAGRTLIYTLPGSLRAVDEYMAEILKTLRHTVLMQYGVDTHGKH
ncbi:MAG: MogA/MoaB family molybdenum cofactor biosynthesis protein [Bacteroidota bacterium]|nr:MogA/MoaB family molybdenum cofactor biosynthesis protein [Bacteroidota bacterium]